MAETTLLDITEVRPLDESDLPVLDELREVLERHGALDRFGLNLLHDHFPVADDEVLVEVCDTEQRTLTIRPLRGGVADGIPGRFVETNFQFVPRSDADADADPDASGTSPVAYTLVCKVGCFVDLKDRHSKTHDKVWG
jgi:hypothetical protein